jgi:DNA (cytosine-5)-methyltransferase 1
MRDSLLHRSERAGGVVIDQFAGPGGWSEGLRMLGYSEIGIEWDDAACATARAAGHERIQADVAAAVAEHGGMSLEDHRERRAHHWVRGFVEGLIGSPPCPTFSNAGKGAGRRDMEHVIACAMEFAAGNDTRAEHRAACEDERSMLVVEPLRWALELRPEWVALEQVPPVLELWTMFGHILEQHGYSVWAGVLEAERYGVPQTRERAILMASRVSTVHPPRPTHQRYVPKEPQRHDVTLEGEILPWVSMAEALGWDDGRAYRLARGEGMLERHGERRAVPKDEPAPVITSKARTADWVYRASTMPNAARRPLDHPAPTVLFAHASNDVSWVMEKKEDRAERRAQGAGNRPRAIDTPAATLDTRTDQAQWTTERPSTTVNGDPRISEPGRHDPNESGSQQKNAIRVTVEEAAILQSFRPGYPWQGSRTKQFEQVGNAVPPLLARAVLAELVDCEHGYKAAGGCHYCPACELEAAA